MIVRDVMSAPAYPCQVDDTLNRVAAVMWDHAIGMVPVLGAEGEVIGVITDRDVAMAAFLTHRPLNQLPVRESMSSTVQTCQDSDPLREVQGRMARAHVRRMPVLDDEGKLVGVISADDLIRASGSGWGLLRAPELVRALGGMTYRAEHDEDAEPKPAPTAQERWQSALRELEGRRDQLRIRMHLAGLDARDEWARLEERLEGLRGSLARAEQRAEAGAAEALRELSDGYSALLSSLRPSEADAAEE